MDNPIIYLSYNKYLKFDAWDKWSEENMKQQMCQIGYALNPFYFNLEYIL